MDADLNVVLEPGKYAFVDNREGVIVFNGDNVTGWIMIGDSHSRPVLEKSHGESRYDIAVKPYYFIVRTTNDYRNVKYSYIKERKSEGMTSHDHITGQFYDKYTIDKKTVTLGEGYQAQVFDKETDKQIN